MKEEINMIEKNDIWELLDWPQHKQPIEWNGFIELN